MEAKDLLEARELGRRMNSEFYLRDVSFRLHPGEAIAIAGRNASGKSVLFSVLTGVNPAQSGEIWMDDKRIVIDKPETAVSKGILMLGQNQPMFPNLKVYENIYFGREILQNNTTKMLNNRRMRDEAAKRLVQMGSSIDPMAPLSSLGDAARQLVGLARAITCGARVLLLDEMTTHLNLEERETFWRAIRGLREDGAGVLMISHDPQELLDQADRVLVMQQGAQVSLQPITAYDFGGLAEAAYGVRAEQLYSRPQARLGGVLLEVERMCAGSLQEVSLAVRAGEIVALLGGANADTAALALAIGGLLPFSGSVKVEGHPIVSASPLSAIGAGVSLAIGAEEEERLEEAQRMIAQGSADGVGSRLLCGMRQSVSQLSRVLGQFALTRHSEYMTGGNRRRELIERAIARTGKVYLLCEPGAGLDLPARMALYEKIGGLAARGAAVLLLTGSANEAHGLADRVIEWKNAE